MTTIMKLILGSLLISGSVILAGEAKLEAKFAHFDVQGDQTSNLTITLGSDENIYGIQFDICYNVTELNLTEDAIVSKVPGINIYSHIKEDGIAQVLMFGMDGQMIIDKTTDKMNNIIDIQFTPQSKFRGTTVVELSDIILAGKAGIEVDYDQTSTYTFEVSFLAPKSTSITKNYPNPFNPTTNIDYELAESGMVTLIIYDLMGAVVKTLVEEYQEENYYSIVWNGRNESGQAVTSGRYILKMSTASFSDTITMTLLK